MRPILILFWKQFENILKVVPLKAKNGIILKIIWIYFENIWNLLNKITSFIFASYFLIFLSKLFLLYIITKSTQDALWWAHNASCQRFVMHYAALCYFKLLNVAFYVFLAIVHDIAAISCLMLQYVTQCCFLLYSPEQITNKNIYGSWLAKPRMLV